jgi:hypothetical protein
MQKKQPNRTYNSGRDIEVNFKPSDKVNNTELLLEFVILHINKSNCENCKWTFAVVGYKNITIVKDFEKSCLVILHLDLIFVKELINILIEKYGFEENTDFKPMQIGFMGALLLYCE